MLKRSGVIGILDPVKTYCLQSANYIGGGSVRERITSRFLFFYKSGRKFLTAETPVKSGTTVSCDKTKVWKDFFFSSNGEG